MPRLTDDRERGAVAVTVALLMVVLIGFVGLAIDVSSAYGRTQEVQNAADAGALGVAQQCAAGSCVGDKALAQDLAVTNIGIQKDTVKTTVTYPEAQRVKVVAESAHHNFFLGLFGVPSFDLREEAVAAWGSPKKGPAMLPLTVSMCSFWNVTNGKPNLDKDVSIYLPSENSGNGSKPDGCLEPTYPPGGFGWLDPNSECESASVVVGGWFTVGSSPGLAAEKCVTPLLKKLVDDKDTVLIPVFSKKSGSGSGGTYYIERFAAFQVLGFELQNGNTKYGAKCGESPTPKNAYTKTCLVGRFVSWAELGDDYTTGAPKTEVSVITLVE